MQPRLARIQNWEELARQANFVPAVMAALCPISLRQLERFFLQQFNKTPGQWSRELRCHLARQLISEGWSNRAAAIEFSFANESHFCREFKRIYGVPPQAFAPFYGSRPSPPKVPLRMSRLCKDVAIIPASPVAASLSANKVNQNHRL